LNTHFIFVSVAELVILNRNETHHKFEEVYRVARVRSVLGNGRQDGYCNFAHQAVVHLYFISDFGVSGDHLYDPRILDQSEELHTDAPPQSSALVVID